jgi:uncharacterized RDD family membrane protein YckC
VKCPKCNYLGFETGDRCKNCGYDFSLMGDPEAPVDFGLDIDLALRFSDDTLPASVSWDDHFDPDLAESPATLEIADPLPELVPEPAREGAARADRKLPLFGHGSVPDDSDAPLVKLPATPRAPLAVRRTPETPRLRAVPRAVPRPSRSIEGSPALDFVEETPPAAVVGAVRESGPPSQRWPVGSPSDPTAAEARARTASRLAASGAVDSTRAVHAEVSGPLPRLAAAAIDHLLLGAIDLAVLYFTLRMAGLTMADLSVLPVVPLVVFLLLVKLSYFSAFTAVGGQTIGKMATRIRVVTAEDETVDGPRAVKRTLAGVVSAALFGLGFVPALIGSERRALHDRLTHTRVVALPSA